MRYHKMKNMSTVTELISAPGDAMHYKITNDKRPIGYVTSTRSTTSLREGNFQAWCGNIDVGYQSLRVNGIPIIYESAESATDAVVSLWERAREKWPDKFFELVVTEEVKSDEYIYTDGIDFK